MPAKAPEKPKASAAAPLFLITGDDDFAVKARARTLFDQWCKEAGGFDHELIDATASNSGAALDAIGKLREALQTLPFFGGAKVIWFQNCNFLAEERTASSAAVTEALAELADELKTFSWEGVRLLITSPKVDKRKVFYKAIDKLGTVETFAGWSVEDKDWVDTAEMAARQQVREARKEIAEDALAALVSNVGPNSRQLSSEIEKLVLYVGERPRIALPDVETIVTRNKQAKSFALADAVGGRGGGRGRKTKHRRSGRARSRALAQNSRSGALGSANGLAEERDRAALRNHFEDADDLVPERNDQGRLDQGGRGLCPVQSCARSCST
jgi:DNA polymerase-3 subunit delta